MLALQIKELDLDLSCQYYQTQCNEWKLQLECLVILYYPCNGAGIVGRKCDVGRRITRSVRWRCSRYTVIKEHKERHHVVGLFCFLYVSKLVFTDITPSCWNSSAFELETDREVKFRELDLSTKDWKPTPMPRKSLDGFTMASPQPVKPLSLVQTPE